MRASFVFACRLMEHFQTLLLCLHNAVEQVLEAMARFQTDHTNSGVINLGHAGTHLALLIMDRQV